MSVNAAAQSPTFDPGSAANDDDLRRREAEISEAESELAAQLDDMAHKGASVSARFNTLQDAVSKRYLDGCEDASFLELMRRCQSTKPPAMAVERHWEESRRARAEALAARQKSLSALGVAFQEFLASIHALETQLNDDEAAFSKMRFEEKRKPLTQGPPPAAPSAAPAAAPAAPAAAAPAAVTGSGPSDNEGAGPQQAPEPAAGGPRIVRPATNGVERRQQQRAELEAVVSFESENNFYTGFSSDISEGGLFISTVETLPRGAAVTLQFTLPSGFRTEVKGIVRWVREYNDMNPEVEAGMGVQFQDLDPEVTERIHAFVEQRDPLFYDA